MILRSSFSLLCPRAPRPVAARPPAQELTASVTLGLSLCLSLASCASGSESRDADTDGISASVSASDTDASTGESTDAATETDASSTANTSDAPGSCGDGVVDGEEECDDGNTDDLDACLTSCVAAQCGDGFVWAGEEDCDDANDDEADGCSSSCKLSTCGDGILEGDEACDDGNTENDDSCLDTCALATCGDGFVLAGEEGCDDGGESAACNEDCSLATCGDGVTNAAASEDCDGGGQTAECNADCSAALCGDNQVNEEAGEGCDDGNTDDGDGCSASCVFESSPQCEKPYGSLTSAARLATNSGMPYYCDGLPIEEDPVAEDWQGPGWYRFDGDAGTQMAVGTVLKNRCGTQKSGWLNGDHPAIADGIVNADVCFSWDNNCNWSKTIQVVNCGDFYLYNLPNVPSCQGGYCGEYG
jgi:cysteine-rich repeat protein